MHFRSTFVLIAAFLFLAGCKASWPIYRSSPPSPSAASDLICHTSNPSECYPRLFQASTEFQIVHDDQDIPPGLHVRLNLETGKKEAKLYDIIAEETEASENGAMLAIPIGEDDDREEGAQLSMVEQSGRTPPPYDPVGRVPRPAHGESEVFEDNIKILLSPRSKAQDLLAALSELEELVHSMHWGIELASRPHLMQRMSSLLACKSSHLSHDEQIRIKADVAMVVGSALQNNPLALKQAAVEGQFHNHCQGDSSETIMESVLLRLFESRQTPKVQERLMYLLSALSKSDDLLSEFFARKGMMALQEVFKSDNTGVDGRDGVRGRVANFVLDTVLKPGSPLDERKLFDRASAEAGWVILDKSGRETGPDNKSFLVSILKGWCTSFGSALNIWRSKGMDETSTAFAKVEAADAALRVKLQDLGSSC